MTCSIADIECLHWHHMGLQHRFFPINILQHGMVMLACLRAPLYSDFMSRKIGANIGLCDTTTKPA